MKIAASVGVGMMLAVIAVLHVVGLAPVSTTVLNVCVASVGVLLCLTEEGRDRTLFASLFAWGYVARLCVLLGLGAILPLGDPAFLGPDGSKFFHVSETMAASGLSLGGHPLMVLGTNSVAHYYLFGGILYLFRGNLYTLHLVNIGLSALVAPLVFSWCRMVVPRYAVLAGVIVALHPSIIAISVVDLWKDPAVIFFTVAAVWAITKVLHSGGRSAWGFAAVATAALIYLRMDRFYVVVHLELAALATLILCHLRRTPRVIPDRGTAVITSFVFGMAEVGPMVLGWPSSPVLLAESVGWTLRTPMMRDYDPGLFGNVFANFFRRLFGPFIWVPPDLDIGHALAGDALLYPGMLIWYALLPFIIVGLASSVRRAGGREANLLLTGLCLFLLLYFAQYMSINLSYRQRDAMLPFLVVFAFIGIEAATRNAVWKRLYFGYWAFLALFACVHLGARMLTRAL